MNKQQVIRSIDTLGLSEDKKTILKQFVSQVKTTKEDKAEYRLLKLALKTY